MVLRISTSVRFFACKLGFLMVISTITSSPKVITFLTAPLSTIFCPSPGTVILSSAFKISCLLSFISFIKNHSKDKYMQ